MSIITGGYGSSGGSGSIVTTTKTKIDLVYDAYSQGRISGITVQPTPEDIKLGLNRLEDLMAEWAGQNICVGYTFEDTPQPNTIHNVPRQYWRAITSNLMVALLQDFGKEPTMALLGAATASFSRLASATAVVPEIQYPNGHPIGSGNKRFGRWRNFYYKTEKAPTECATVEMAIGDIRNFYEDFASYLIESETIASYVLTSDEGLTVTDDAISENRIDYTVEAVGNSPSPNGLYEVKIVATMSSGRIETRLRNFVLTEIEIT